MRLMPLHIEKDEAIELNDNKLFGKATRLTPFPCKATTTAAYA